MKIVLEQAHRYHRSTNHDFDDLVSAGNLGLIKAAKRYDVKVSRGARFSTYALYWIRQSIRRELDNHSKSVRIPVYLHSKRALIIRIKEQIQGEIERMPTNAELAELTGVSEASIDFALSHSESSMDSETSFEGGETVANFIAYAEHKEDQLPDSAILKKEDIATAMELLDTLDDKAKRIIQDRFGLNKEGKSYTLEEIGKKFGVTGERIRQIEEKALKTLGFRFRKLNKVFD